MDRECEGRHENSPDKWASHYRQNCIKKKPQKRRPAIVAGNEGQVAGNEGRVAENEGRVAGNEGRVAGNEGR